MLEFIFYEATHTHTDITTEKYIYIYKETYVELNRSYFSTFLSFCFITRDIFNFMYMYMTRWNLIQLNFVDEMCSFNTKFMIFYKTKTQTFCLPYLL
jgi:hypothetical protein